MGTVMRFYLVYKVVGENTEEGFFLANGLFFLVREVE